MLEARDRNLSQMEQHQKDLSALEPQMKALLEKQEQCRARLPDGESAREQAVSIKQSLPRYDQLENRRAELTASNSKLERLTEFIPQNRDLLEQHTLSIEQDKLRMAQMEEQLQQEPELLLSQQKLLQEENTLQALSRSYREYQEAEKKHSPPSMIKMQLSTGSSRRRKGFFGLLDFFIGDTCQKYGIAIVYQIRSKNQLMVLLRMKINSCLRRCFLL